MVQIREGFPEEALSEQDWKDEWEFISTAKALACPRGLTGHCSAVLAERTPSRAHVIGRGHIHVPTLSGD